jgi:uncharacterized protein YjbI with pentapeptide repeats
MTRFWQRLTSVIAGFAGLVGALWLLFFPITELFATGDVAGMNAVERFSAISTLRGQIGAVVSAGFVAAGLYYTGRKYFLDRDKQYTDRFNTAVDHLGSPEEIVRAGGLRALDRILHDSAVDRQRVLRTVTGFLRKQPSHDRGNIPDDIAAALDVLRDRGAPSRRHGPDPLDLHGVRLAHTDLHGLRLAGADLAAADLVGADLRNSVLERATAGEAILVNADLRQAVLAGADLRKARLTQAVLADADLSEADLRGAELTGADFTGANLAGADLRATDLRGARDLTTAQLARSRMDAQTLLPEPPTSGAR